MDTEKQWRVAMASLNAFYANIPGFLRTEHIQDYNLVVESLEKASGEDLSHFKVPPDRLRPKVTNVGPGTRQYSNEKYCDAAYFKRQIDGLKNYTATLHPRSEGNPDYEQLNDYALHDLMQDRKIKPPMTIEHGQPVYRMPTRKWMLDALRRNDNPPIRSQTINNYNLKDSNMIQSSPGASISISSSGIKKEELASLLEGVRELFLESDIDAETRERVELTIGTINVHLNTPNPDTSIIKASLLSLKAIAENSAGAMLASSLLPTLVHLIGKLP